MKFGSNIVQALITFDTSYFKVIDFLNQKYGKGSCEPNSYDGAGVAEIAVYIGDDSDVFTYTVGVNQMNFGRYEFANYHIGLSMQPSPHAIEIITALVEEFGGYMLIDGEPKYLGKHMTEDEFNNIQYVGVASRRFWRFGVARKKDNYGKSVDAFFPGDKPEVIECQMDQFNYLVEIGDFKLDRPGNNYTGLYDDSSEPNYEDI